jgi:hypothetical protein
MLLLLILLVNGRIRKNNYGSNRSGSGTLVSVSVVYSPLISAGKNPE